jgi:sec-independent protein translocase protein TatA
VLFGSKRLKSLGADLGEAITGFRRAVRSEEQASPAEASARLDSAAEVSGKDTAKR